MRSGLHWSLINIWKLQVSPLNISWLSGYGKLKGRGKRKFILNASLHWEETWCVCENSFHRFNSTWHWITFLWNLSRLSHDFSFLTQFDFSPPHLLICLGLFQIQLTRNHFSSKTPSLPLGSSFLWDPLLHTLLTLLSYLPLVSVQNVIASHRD